MFQLGFFKTLGLCSTVMSILQLLSPGQFFRKRCVLTQSTVDSFNYPRRTKELQCKPSSLIKCLLSYFFVTKSYGFASRRPESLVMLENSYLWEGKHRESEIPRSMEDRNVVFFACKGRVAVHVRQVLPSTYLDKVSVAVSEHNLVPSGLKQSRFGRL